MLAKKSDISSKELEICMIIYKCRTDKNSFAGTNRKEITEQNMIKKRNILNFKNLYYIVKNRSFNQNIILY